MLGRSAACAFALALSAIALMTAETADGRPKVRFDQDWAQHPSARYAALTAAECLEALAQRKIVFTPVRHAPGVLAPVRLLQGVGGVFYRTAVPEHLRAENPNDVFDCRLALSLSDFSKILRAHDIDEVLMFSAWRPPSKRWPDGKLAGRHGGALALDAYRFGKKKVDGELSRTWLDVERDFGGRRGAPVCAFGTAGPGSVPAILPAVASRNAPAARELRSIVCEAVDQHIFTAMLTPNYDRAHKNHLHLEVTPSVEWELVR
jgi:hypothetical protein